MTLCPCGSRKPLEACCGPILAGAPAPTAEALMRSRYTAYAQGDMAHLERTLAAAIRGEFEAEETARTAGEARWQGLDVRAVTGGGEGDDTGTVEFTVRFRLRGQTHVQHERATFAREDGRWVYTGGEDNPKEAPRQAEKVGRNDPCPCGSGRKYKKCCGAG